MKKNGFSIIELLAVVFIISLLASVMTVDFSSIREQLALKRAVHQLAQDLRDVQSMALSSNDITQQCGVDSKPQAYGLFADINSDNKTYYLYADTSKTAGFGYDINDCILKTVSIRENRVIIKQINNTANDQIDVNFSPPNCQVRIKDLDAEAAEIVLALELKPDIIKTVAINLGGALEIK